MFRTSNVDIFPSLNPTNRTYQYKESPQPSIMQKNINIFPSLNPINVPTLNTANLGLFASALRELTQTLNPNSKIALKSMQELNPAVLNWAVFENALVQNAKKYEALSTSGRSEKRNNIILVNLNQGKTLNRESVMLIEKGDREEQKRATFTNINERASNNKNQRSSMSLNSQMFPSLHPLGPVYNSKRKTPYITLASIEQMVSLDPVKKVKAENCQGQTIDLSAGNMSFDKQDEVVFRVPQLPRRLRGFNGAQSLKRF